MVQRSARRNFSCSAFRSPSRRWRRASRRDPNRPPTSAAAAITRMAPPTSNAMSMPSMDLLVPRCMPSTHCAPQVFSRHQDYRRLISPARRARNRRCRAPDQFWINVILPQLPRKGPRLPGSTIQFAPMTRAAGRPRPRSAPGEIALGVRRERIKIAKFGRAAKRRGRATRSIASGASMMAAMSVAASTVTSSVVGEAGVDFARMRTRLAAAGFISNGGGLRAGPSPQATPRAASSRTPSRGRRRRRRPCALAARHRSSRRVAGSPRATARCVRRSSM